MYKIPVGNDTYIAVWPNGDYDVIIGDKRYQPNVGGLREMWEIALTKLFQVYDLPENPLELRIVVGPQYFIQAFALLPPKRRLEAADTLVRRKAPYVTTYVKIGDITVDSTFRLSRRQVGWHPLRTFVSWIARRPLPEPDGIRVRTSSSTRGSNGSRKRVLGWLSPWMTTTKGEVLHILEWAAPHR